MELRSDDIENLDEISEDIRAGLVAVDKDEGGKVDAEVLVGAVMFDTESHIWAINDLLLDTLASLHGRIIEASTVQAVVEARKAQQNVAANGKGGVAVVPIHGIITPKTSLISLLFGGGGGLDMLRAQVNQAVNNPEVKSIVLDVDSPGGMVDQVEETAQVIRQARDTKPIVAVANTQAGSAAYWLASQAHEVVSTPSGEVGSIGAYSLHKDISGALEQAGIKTTIIKAGKYKAEDTPFEPLSTDAQAARQQAVDDFYTAFVNGVAQGRGVSPENVQSGYGEGRALGAKRAKAAGLVDKIATLDQTVARLSSGRARVKDSGAQANTEPEELETSAPEAAGDISPQEKARAGEVLSWLAA